MHIYGMTDSDAGRDSGTQPTLSWCIDGCLDVGPLDLTRRTTWTWRLMCLGVL